MNKHQVAYISHGGGPLPLLGDPEHQEMNDTLKLLGKRVRRPSAILVVSAHWEEHIPAITAAANPSLIYDYGGFPKEAYEIDYPCKGEPELASKIKCLFDDAGIESDLDHQRGLDHGVYVPLKIMYPEAGIPVVQLSLDRSLDPAKHLQIGFALRNLDWDGLLVVGSGFSFHNMREFFTKITLEKESQNLAFEQWLRATISDPTVSEQERFERLRNWERAPSARYCHPREEHLMPLHVCAGLAGMPSSRAFECKIMGKESSMFYWDEKPS